MTYAHPNNDPPVLKGLSRFQYGTMKFIHENRVTMSYLRIAHAGTLASIADPRRGYLVRLGPNDDDIVILSKVGEAVLASYMKATLNERSHEREMTERCQRLMRYSARRKVVSMAS